MPSFLIALLTPALLAAERYGVAIPYFTGDKAIRAGVMLACLLVQALLCRHAIAYGVRMLRRRRCVSELLVSVAALLSAADTLFWLFVPGRCAAPPYVCVATAGLFFAQWGLARTSRGDWDAFRAAALDDDPPYLVTETVTGACKQRGALRGFYTAAVREGASERYQTVLLPLVFAAAFVFAGLTAFGADRGADFLLHWSAILSAGATFSLPLCWGLPWSRTAKRWQKLGCAVAGWDGAYRVSRRRAMILTEADLFPPGTVRLNGVKVYGEEIGRAAAYAAAVTREAGCALNRLFEDLAAGETAPREQAHDLNFYKEGGWSCTIHGETVLLGTASFMRKKELRMPDGIHLKTGVYLAVDGAIAAVFAVKYDAAESVDYALRITRRGRVTPILAVRDPNVTPDLLKRKFRKDVKVDYPDLSRRIALSEAGEGRGLPRALLLREGLLPYAEAVVGSRRLCAATGRSLRFSLLGSVARFLPHVRLRLRYGHPARAFGVPSFVDAPRPASGRPREPLLKPLLCDFSQKSPLFLRFLPKVRRKKDFYCVSAKVEV